MEYNVKDNFLKPFVLKVLNDMENMPTNKGFCDIGIQSGYDYDITTITLENMYEIVKYINECIEDTEVFEYTTDTEELLHQYIMYAIDSMIEDNFTQLVYNILRKYSDDETLITKISENADYNSTPQDCIDMLSGIYTVYAEHDDMTFIMQEKYNTISVIGFYFGKPNNEATEKFKNNLTATIDI